MLKPLQPSFGRRGFLSVTDTVGARVEHGLGIGVGFLGRDASEMLAVDALEDAGKMLANRGFDEGENGLLSLEVEERIEGPLDREARPQATCAFEVRDGRSGADHEVVGDAVAQRLLAVIALEAIGVRDDDLDGPIVVLPHPGGGQLLEVAGLELGMVIGRCCCLFGGFYLLGETVHFLSSGRTLIIIL